jgi:hypothetical protein
MGIVAEVTQTNSGILSYLRQLGLFQPIGIIAAALS